MNGVPYVNVRGTAGDTKTHRLGDGSHGRDKHNGVHLRAVSARSKLFFVLVGECVVNAVYIGKENA